MSWQPSDRLPGPRHLAGHSDLFQNGAALPRAAVAARVCVLAERLLAHGIGPREQVALAFANSIDYVTWLLAIFATGAVAVPLDPRLAGEAVADLCETAGIGFLAAPVDALNAEYPMWSALDSAAVPGCQLWQRRCDAAGERPAADCLLRQFTSGSTGQAKHLLRTEAQIAADYGHFVRGLNVTGEDRYLALAPFYHAYGALGLYASLAVGAQIHIQQRFLPAEVLATAREFRPTVLLATPSMIDLLGRCYMPDSEHDAFAALRYCICSTGHLGASAAAAFEQRFGIPVRVQYGSTETLSATIDLAENFLEGRVGRPYPGVDVQVFGEHGEMLPAGAIGRVGIRSAASCGSYTDPAIHMARIDDYVLPGDRGWLDADQALHIAGRDDVYNIGGYKVDRFEVEQCIRAALPVRYVAVLPFERAGHAALRALIEADPAQVDSAAVSKACQAALLGYKVPARVDIRDALPRDLNGKVRTAEVLARIDLERLGVIR